MVTFLYHVFAPLLNIRCAGSKELVFLVIDYQPKGKIEYHLEILNVELDSTMGWDFGFLPWVGCFKCGKKNEIFQ